MSKTPGVVDATPTVKTDDELYADQIETKEKIRCRVREMLEDLVAQSFDETTSASAGKMLRIQAQTLNKKAIQIGADINDLVADRLAKRPFGQRAVFASGAVRTEIKTK